MFAAKFLAHGEGLRLQAPRVLAMVQQALEAPDEDLQRAVLKLESELWTLPEAIDKASALELLKSRFSDFDEAEISSAYEILKAGLYDARNQALIRLGEPKRRIQASEHSGNSAYAAEALRQILLRIQKDFSRDNREGPIVVNPPLTRGVESLPGDRA